MRAAFGARGGTEIDTQGDSVDGEPTTFPALKAQRRRRPRRLSPSASRRMCIEESFTSGSARAPLGLAAGGLAILALTVALLVALVFLVRAVL